MLRVLVVDDNLKLNTSLKKMLSDNGFDVIQSIDASVNIESVCLELVPDMLVIDTQSPSQDILQATRTLADRNTLPIIMFAKDGNKDMVQAATKAGVNAYVVGTISNERFKPVMDAAIARFEETKQLRNQLNQTKIKLDERKLVERAKGILMRQRNLDEDEAYSLLRSMAMQKNMKLADLSNQLLDVAKMLTV